MGNQIAGREINQNRKKHKKSLVVVPDEAGRWFAAKRRLAMESKGAKRDLELTKVVDAGPHCAQHHEHAIATYACLNAIPDTRVG
jgi:hypothetical protein